MGHSYEVEVKSLLGSPERAEEIRKAMKAVDSSIFFLSRRRHTSSLCDWSSDLCSSDLSDGAVYGSGRHHGRRNMLSISHREKLVGGSRYGANTPPPVTYAGGNADYGEEIVVLPMRSEERSVGNECS